MSWALSRSGKRSDKVIRVRFAPSPTGPLHIGGARTALFNYLLARKEGGKFILRIEDTDRERSTSEFEEDIKDSLQWLGISWDEGPDLKCEPDFGPYRQSERIASHKEAAEKLHEEGRAYLDSEGVLRLRYPEDEIIVCDAICGDCVFKPEALGGEPAILRSDGTPTYHIANVVDDIAMKITHVVRGQDHLTNTAKHKVLFEALGAEAPTFAHLPLILGEDGSKLSKRSTFGMTTVSEFRSAGYLPEALVNFLALLGWSHPEEKETLSLEEVISAFELKRVNNVAAKFEVNKLNFLNGWWIRAIPETDLAERALEFSGEYRELIEKRGQSFWSEAIGGLRSKLGRLDETEELASLIFSLDIELQNDAAEFLKTSEGKEGFPKVAEAWTSALDETPLELDRDCYTIEQAKTIVKSLKKRVEVPNKVIFQSLRTLVTGTLSGPDLNTLVSITTRDVLLERARSVRVLS